MRIIGTIAKKELSGYLQSPVGYIFAGLLFLVANSLFMSSFFLAGQADLTGYWGIVVYLFTLFIPAISMGLIAEEKKTSTWETLLSLPISETQLVLGKYMGSLGYLFGISLLTVPTIAMIYFLGTPDAGLVGGGYLGVMLLGASYLALGIFSSALSNSPIVGFLVSVVVLLVNNLLGQELLLSHVPGFLKSILSSLSLAYRSGRFQGGLISINDLVFFLSWISIFLTLTVLILKSRDK